MSATAGRLLRARDSELIDAALRYLPRTLPLFGKVPAVGNGWPQWKANPETLWAWFAKHGERPDANLGIRTGHGLVGLDVDVWDDGNAALRQLERKHGRLPSTPTVITGREGRHHYFRGPRNLCSRDLRTIGLGAIEIKAAGCQLVAPPSVHPDTGRLYCWHPQHPLIDSEIAPLPDWLVQLAGNESMREPGDFSGLSERDSLHCIPAELYVWAPGCSKPDTPSRTP